MDELDEIIKQINDEFGEGTITTASEMPRPQSSLDREAFDDFNTRNPMAGGGRIGLYKGMSAKKAPQKFKLEKEKTSSGFAGDRKLTQDQIDSLDPDYLGKINIEDAENKSREKNVKVYKSGATKYGSVLDDAIEIRNIIVKNKGNIFNLEELGEKAGIYTSGTGSRKSGKGNRPDTRRVRTALILAKDNFPEIANFKFVATTKTTKGRYKIDGKERHQLNMVVDTIKAYQNTTGDEKLAQFLPDNMGQFYKKILEKGPKKLPGNPEQGLFIKMYNFGPEQIKYISDRITDETGQKFTPKDYNNLVKDVRKFRSQVSTNKRLETRLANMNKVIVDLANDNQIQNLLKGTLDRKTQEALLARATQIVGGDASIASRRLFQMAEAMSDTTNAYKNLGIKINNNIANKIIATGKEIGGRNNRYGMSSVLYDYYGNVVDKAIGSGEGQTFIGKYQQAIRNALDKGQSPDEIFSLTASARTRVPGQGNLAPYALFTQQLRTDVNSAIKGAYIDSALSRTHGKLQEIFKGKKYSQLNASEKEAANALVEAFEKEKIRALNQPINPGEVKKGAKPIYLTAAEKKNIQLPEFDLKNPPSKSIEGFAKRFVKYPKIKEAFEKSYKDVGYSMKVTKDMQTQKEFLNKLYASFSANPKCRVTFGKGQKEGGRIGYATGPANLVDCADSGKKRLEKVIKTGVKLGPQEGALATQILKAGRALGSGLTLSGMFGPAAIAFTTLAEAGLVGYDMLSEGKTFREAVGDSLFNYALGEKTKIDPQEELFKRFKGLGYNNEQMFKIKKALDTANTLNTGVSLGMDIVNQKKKVDELGKQYEQDSQQIMMPEDEQMQSDQLFRAQKDLQNKFGKMAEFDQNLESVPVGDTEAPIDRLNKYIQSGEYAQGLELFSDADRLTNIQKAETALDRALSGANPLGGQLKIDELRNKLRELKLNDPNVRRYQEMTGGFPIYAGFSNGGYGKDAAKYIKEIETDHHKGYQYYKKHGGKKSFKQYMRESMSKYFAGGGIAGLSGGDPKGAMTRSMNPDSQGLSYLFNRGKKT